MTPTYLTENEAGLWMITPGFDDLLLTGETLDANGHAFTIEALDNETATLDNPVPIDVAIQRWQTDGAVAATQGNENRQPRFDLVVSAETAEALAAGEEALALRSAKRCLLKWTPPAGSFTPASVFEVWTWNLDHGFSISREMRLSRLYNLTATAKPWVRALDLTIVSALPSVPTPTVTVVDTCGSLNPTTPTAASWASGSTAAPATVVGGTVRTAVTGFVASKPQTVDLSLIRTGTVTIGSTPLLALDMTVSTAATSVDFIVIVDGQTLTKVAVFGTVSYWALPASATSFAKLTVVAQARFNAGQTVSGALAINTVSLTDGPGGLGSHKQIDRSFPVGGSVKTSGSIQIASPSSTGLGTCLIYTRPTSDSGYVPPLRRYHVSGQTVTADTTCVSGSREALITAGADLGGIRFEVPANQIDEASYSVVGRFKTDVAAAAMVLTTQFGVGAQAAAVTLSSRVKFPASGLFGWGVLGTISLPAQQLPPESTALTWVTINGTSDSTTGQHQWLDELYLLDITHGDVSIVAAGSATRLRIDAPDADPVRDRPAVYLATQSDWSDAYGVTTSQLAGGSFAVHDLDPRGTSMLVVTDTVDDALASLAFYKRGHTYLSGS